MSLLTNLKLNRITKLIKMIEDTTANQDILDAVIKFINENSGKFTPEIDMTKVNSFIEDYLNKNASTFQGIKGDPPSTVTITLALGNYFNNKTQTDFIDATFSNIKKIDNQLICGNTTLTKYAPPINNISPNFDIQTKNIKGNIGNFDILGSNLTSEISVSSKLNATNKEILCGKITCKANPDSADIDGTISGLNKLDYKITRFRFSRLDIVSYTINIFDSPTTTQIVLNYHTTDNGVWFIIANGLTSQILVKYPNWLYQNQQVYLASGSTMTFVYLFNAFMVIGIS